jgi:hypothetical protein
VFKRWRSLVDDPASPDEGNALAQRLRLLDVVRRQHDRQPLVGVQTAQVRPQLVAKLEVDARSRLVEDEQAWPMDERSRYQ